MRHLMRFWMVLCLCLVAFSAHADSQLASPNDSTQLALDLYDQLRALVGDDENLFFSPYSINTALLMTYAGARGNTAAQMRQALYIREAEALLNQVVRDYGAGILARNNIPADTYSAERVFAVANALWIQDGFALAPTYPQTLTDFYHASIAPLDFVGAPDVARQTINQAIAQQTRERIQNLIPDGVINADTRLILTNAVYFKADWAKPFTALERAPFTLTDGTTLDVPSITKQDNLPYRAGEGYVAVAVPYSGYSSQMVLILPDDFEAFSASIAQHGLPSLLDADLWREVRLTLPKFEFTSTFSLSNALQALGMTDAFNPTLADFSGMTDATALYLQEALHKAFIAVDENGTEAAAATAIIVGVTSMPIVQEPIVLTIDKPFLFYIQDTQSGEILFMGQVINPAS